MRREGTDGASAFIEELGVEIGIEWRHILGQESVSHTT